MRYGIQELVCRTNASMYTARLRARSKFGVSAQRPLIHYPHQSVTQARRYLAFAIIIAEAQHQPSCACPHSSTPQLPYAAPHSPHPRAEASAVVIAIAQRTCASEGKCATRRAGTGTLGWSRQRRDGNGR